MKIGRKFFALNLRSHNIFFATGLQHCSLVFAIKQNQFSRGEERFSLKKFDSILDHFPSPPPVPIEGGRIYAIPKGKSKKLRKKGDNDDDARTTSINLLFHRNNMVSSSSATLIPLSILTKSGSQFLPRDVHSRFLVWRLYILNYKASLPLRLESRQDGESGWRADWRRSIRSVPNHN